MIGPAVKHGIFRRQVCDHAGKIKIGRQLQSMHWSINPWVAFGELDQYLPYFARGLVGDERLFRIGNQSNRY